MCTQWRIMTNDSGWHDGGRLLVIAGVISWRPIWRSDTAVYTSSLGGRTDARIFHSAGDTNSTWIAVSVFSPVCCLAAESRFFRNVACNKLRGLPNLSTFYICSCSWRTWCRASQRARRVRILCWRFVHKFDTWSNNPLDSARWECPRPSPFCSRRLNASSFASRLAQSFRPAVWPALARALAWFPFRIRASRAAVCRPILRLRPPTRHPAAIPSRHPCLPSPSLLCNRVQFCSSIQSTLCILSTFSTRSLFSRIRRSRIPVSPPLLAFRDCILFCTTCDCKSSIRINSRKLLEK